MEKGEGGRAAQGQPPHGETSQEIHGSPPPAYEEVTLADLLDVLIRRRLLITIIFTLVVLSTVAITATTPPTYEASATLLPTNEQGAIVSVMQSRSFATDVADRLGVTYTIGFSPERAGQALQSSVTVTKGTGQIGDQDKTIITVTARAQAPEDAQRRANAYVDELADWRGYLESVTRDKNWEAYYEQADKNATKADQQIQDLVDGLTYYKPLDEATRPSAPTSPDWQLNLALGTTLGAMLALFIPFLVEGVANALEERRRAKALEEQRQAEQDTSGST